MRPTRLLPYWMGALTNFTVEAYAITNGCDTRDTAYLLIM